MKKILLCIIAIFILAILYSASIYSKEENENDMILSLLYPGAYNIYNHTFKKTNVIQIQYLVKLPYPSLDVLNFYDNELKKKGWKEHTTAYFDNTQDWISVWDGTIKGEPLTHRLDSYWVNKSQNKIVVLMLEYRSYNLGKKEILKSSKPNNNIQRVILQIGPYSELASPPRP